MFKFVALFLGLLGQRIIVLADVAAQVPFTSQSGYGSQYGANFNHAFADPRQDLLSDPVSLTTLVVRKLEVETMQMHISTLIWDLMVKSIGLSMRKLSK